MQFNVIVMFHMVFELWNDWKAGEETLWFYRKQEKKKLKKLTESEMKNREEKVRLDKGTNFNVFF